jgi:hypothetical protein
MYGMYHIKANSLQEALQLADDAELPTDQDFLDGSFEIDKDMLPFYNKLSEEEINKIV